jgi:hypothetical protein
MTINAIDTYYAGHLFRSRLEARWAVFFNSLGIRWEYEPQGYRVGEDRRPYLPDFYLTDLGWWIEVKGDHQRLDVSLLLDAVHPTLGLGRTDPHHMTNILVLGDIPRQDMPHGHFSVSRTAVIGNGGPLTWGAKPRCPALCPIVGPRFGLYYFWPVPDTIPDFTLTELGITPKEYGLLRRRGAVISPACRTSGEQLHDDLTQAMPLGKLGKSPRLEAAYLLARTARFEHGARAS